MELVTCNVFAKIVKLTAEKWVEGFPGPFKKEIFAWHRKSKTYHNNVTYEKKTQQVPS